MFNYMEHTLVKLSDLKNNNYGYIVQTLTHSYTGMYSTLLGTVFTHFYKVNIIQ